MYKRIFLMGILFGLIITVLTHTPPMTQAASSDPGLSHCTDWPIAQIADSSRPVATRHVDEGFQIYDIREGVADFWSIGWLIPSDETERDNYQWKAPNWRVLIRPGGTFAVFYSTLSTNPNNRIYDPDPATNTFYDEDNDTVPDYVERVYSCLETSHARYQQYYGLTNMLPWLYLSVRDKNGVITSEHYYPVSVKYVGAIGTVQPVIATGKSLVTNTFMEIDSGNRPYFIDGNNQPKVLVRDSLPWLYPKLENTIYHEMAHVYQALFKQPYPQDLRDNWIYEGTAVYMADQALLPECATTTPPRIPLLNGATYPALCRIPNIYERDSETRLSTNRFITKPSDRSNDSDWIFDRPWLGMTRDDNENAGGNSSYSSVLFWYYAQAKLQGQAGNDVLKTFWQQGKGNDDVIADWATSRYPPVAPWQDGLSTMYHRYMIANYLQDVVYQEYQNPYFVPWWQVPPNLTPPWSVPTSLNRLRSRPNIVAGNTTQLNLSTATNHIFKGNINDIATLIEPFGTRYYAIDIRTYPTWTWIPTSEVGVVDVQVQMSVRDETSKLWRFDGLGAQTGVGEGFADLGGSSIIVPCKDMVDRR